MNGEERLTRTQRDDLAAAVLARHPEAWVVAVEVSGLLVPMPASLDVGTHPVVTGHSTALGLVEPDDRIIMLNTWDRAVRTGGSSSMVRMVGQPEATALHFLDLTHRHGVYLGIFVGPADGVAELPVQRDLRVRVGTMRKDQLSVTTTLEPTVTEILGWTAEEMVGRRSLDFIHPEDQQQAIAAWVDLLATPGGERRVRYRHRHRDGSWIWLEVTHRNRLADPAHGDIEAEVVDITHEMAAQESLLASERLLRRLTEALPVGVLQLDADRRVVYANHRLARMLGTPIATSVTGQFDCVLAEDRHLLFQAIDEVLAGSQDTEVEIAFRGPNRRVRRATVTVSSLTSEAGEPTGAILCLLDVTRDVHLRQQLEDRATYDGLTRCRNRASILQSLQHLVTDRADAGIAVMFIDLDQFKEVNDRLGHAAGDQLLGRVGRRLLTTARGRDLVGRIGGDEFLLVCTDVETAATAMSIARRAAGRIRAPINLSGERVAPRASIGVVWSRSECSDADQLIAEADAAMYESKRQYSGIPALRVIP